MPTLYVREVPDSVYETAQKIAESKGQSLNAYVLTLLEEATAKSQRRKRTAEILDAVERRRQERPPLNIDVVAMIREMRGPIFED